MLPDGGPGKAAFTGGDYHAIPSGSGERAAAGYQLPDRELQFWGLPGGSFLYVEEAGGGVVIAAGAGVEAV